MSPDSRSDLELRHPGGVTPVFAGVGAVERAGPWVAEWIRDRQVFFVTTPLVETLLMDRWRESVAEARSATVLRVAEGEAAKTIDVAGDLWTRMIAAGGKRDSRVVALGGGSVGDLAGFVAAAFLRGVEILQVPTTLLAQVDAGIGGKTAIDHGGAKNSVGAFHHPAAVVADASALDSLPAEEFRSGLVEVLKMAAADDLQLFERLEERLDELLGRQDMNLLGEIVKDAIAAKIRVVEADPRESNRRRTLNLGHTLGHAIESCLDYRELRHGEAVAYGLLFALRLAVAHGGDAEWAERVERLVLRLDLPPLPPLGIDALLASIERDKKATRAGVFWVLPVAPGRVEITNRIESATLRDVLEGFLGARQRA